MKDILLFLLAAALFAGAATSFAEIVGLTSVDSALTPTTVGAGLLAVVVSYLIYRKR